MMKNNHKEDDFTDLIKAIITFNIVIYMITYGLTIGPTTWVYIGETMPPSSLGIAYAWKWMLEGIILGIQWGLAHIYGISRSEKSFDQTISAIFFIYSAVWIWGYFLVLVFVEETKGLSRKSLVKVPTIKYLQSMEYFKARSTRLSK